MLACGKRFTNNLGFERMWSSPAVITLAMQSYFDGSTCERNGTENSSIILISASRHLYSRAVSFEAVEAELGEQVYSPL